MKRVLLTTGVILPLIILATIGAILYGRGYRFSTGEDLPQMIAGTGLLVVTSNPDGARVYVDGELKTATNNTINLRPGEYDVSVQKDGYFPWQKRVKIEEEVVTEASARLFPIAPKLESLTTTGALNPVVDPTGSLIAYTVASASANRNGVYILSMRTRPILPSGGSISQIATEVDGDFSSAQLLFSPDGKDLIASQSALLGTETFLFTGDGYETGPQDITASLPLYTDEWENQKIIKRNQTITSLPRKMRSFAQSNFDMMELAPEENKLLYTASASATIPPMKKAVPGGNTTSETRTIEPGSIYVYDIKDDKNYLLWKKVEGAKQPNFLWHADSGHLIFVEETRINVIQYDGQNKTTIYAGPFEDNFVVPWPDGSNLVILTNLNIPGAPENLYRISLR